MLEFKNINAEVKDVDIASRTVSGYLSKFGNIDHHNDIMQKGAYAKSINERSNDIYFLYQHDWSKPLQKGFNVLKEDDNGLYFESEIVDTSYGLDAIKLYDSGVLAQHSVGFETIKSNHSAGKPRVITEVKLWEGSAVTMAANPEAVFMGFKSLTLNEIKDQTTKILKLLRNGTLTDDTFIQLELALKMLQTKSFELRKQQSKKSEEPTVVTPNNYEPLLNKLSNFKL